MKVLEHKGIYFCVVSLFTGLVTMARGKPVSAVASPPPTTTTTGSKLDGTITPPNPNSRSDISPLSKAMEALEIPPFSLDASAINLDMPESRLGSSIRSKLVEEETTLEDMIVDLILDGQWELLQPNSGKSVVLGDGKSVSVSYHEEPGSGYRTWEWHGHVMVYEDGEGYVPEYVYGNYFEPLESDSSSMNNMDSMNHIIGLGGYIRGLGFIY
ncbi:hypothetical protein M758_7G156200 [Ceratodon purpureus]|uniref:Uncharacterized protein n=1 Tax=Ceratodon purpureus TaxID=3225 RepID=A0A8T0H985_CERPU|nr:hypothetical protein KC19_7G122100 [Ceratodon purpureus]KAG0611660.1 hypothetical protein M758_7G156200 [Ceratodon purpureus]